jgi:uncharacterized protein YaiL (DUF2058 family)
MIGRLGDEQTAHREQSVSRYLIVEQNRTEQNRTEQNRTEQNRTEQNRTEQNRTEQNRTEPSNTAQLIETNCIRQTGCDTTSLSHYHHGD